MLRCPLFHPVLLGFEWRGDNSYDTVLVGHLFLQQVAGPIFEAQEDGVQRSMLDDVHEDLEGVKE